MKVKILSLLMILFLICGCQVVKDKSMDDIVANVTTQTKKYNTYHTGFKYYLPVGLNVSKSSLYNDEIISKDFKLYLYADVISYHNKSKIEYEENNKSYYSKKIENGKKKGYVEINLQENNEYLIEIMYNYAKIEVMVDSDKINMALEYAVTILQSIKYNDNVIANLLENDILNYQEEEYNIFNTTSSDSNYLKYVEADNYEDDNKNDDDLIK